MSISGWREDDYIEEEDERDIGTCQGCGAYGWHGEIHVRRGEECGEFL